MICTSIEQSKKLIKLGIDIETADMCWCNENPMVQLDNDDFHTYYTEFVEIIKENNPYEFGIKTN